MKRQIKRKAIRQNVARFLLACMTASAVLADPALAKGLHTAGQAETLAAEDTGFFTSADSILLMDAEDEDGLLMMTEEADEEETEDALKKRRGKAASEDDSADASSEEPGTGAGDDQEGSAAGDDGQNPDGDDSKGSEGSTRRDDTGNTDTGSDDNESPAGDDEQGADGQAGDGSASGGSADHGDEPGESENGDPYQDSGDETKEDIASGDEAGSDEDPDELTKDLDTDLPGDVIDDPEKNPETSENADQQPELPAEGKVVPEGEIPDPEAPIPVIEEVLEPEAEPISEDLKDSFSLATPSDYLEISGVFLYDADLPLDADGNTIWQNDFTWSKRNNAITLSAYKGSSTKINIPSYAIIDGWMYDVELSYRMFSNSSSASKITSVVLGEGVKLPNNSTSLFQGMTSLTTVDISGADASSTTTFTTMFSGCAALKSVALGSLDTSKVTNMSSMFKECNALTEADLHGLDTSAVKNMGSIFYNCGALTKVNLTGLDTSAVTGMANMFYGCSKLTSISLQGLNTSNVTSMSGMFRDCTALKDINLKGLDTRSVTNMSYMFNNCRALTSIDLSPLNTGKVTNFSYMFNNCRKLKSLDVTTFDTSVGTNFAYMFAYTRSLTSLDISRMDFGSVKDLSYTKSTMFIGCPWHLSRVNTPTEAQIRAYAKQYPFSLTMADTWAVTPNISKEVAGKLSAATVRNALNTLNFVRYIAGIPAVENDTGLEEYAQTGTTLLIKVGDMTHTPKQPAGVSDAFYEKGYYGTSHSNLGWGHPTLAGAVVAGWMYDGDSSNIAATGHRRWCLDPSMTITGFGHSGTYTAMISIDSSRTSFDYDYVLWPAQLQPIDYFSGPWTIMLNSRYYEYDKGNTVVTMRDKKTGKSYTITESNTDKSGKYMKCSGSSYGSSKAIIFQPGVSFSSGSEVEVKVTGLKDDLGDAVTIGYTVKFFRLGTTDTYQKVTSVKLNQTTATLSVNNSMKLTAAVAPSDASNKELKWTSSNTAVATVDSSGKVTGKKAGTVTIKAAAQDGSGKSASCKVTVKTVNVTGVKLDKATASVRAKKTLQLTATVSPSDASDKTVTWSSSDTRIATVSSSGLVTGVKAGTATITVTTKDQSKKATCKLTVQKPLPASDAAAISRIEQTASGVKLTWKAVTDSDNYTIYRKTAGDSKWTKLGTSGSTTYTDKTERLRQNYVYAVRCTEGNQTIAASDKYTMEFSCTRFRDVLTKSYYFNPVYWAVDEAITNGFNEDNTFRPQDYCTRAQMVTFLWRVAGKPSPSSTVNPFPDVKEGMYYYNAVLWAAENGITKGYSNGSFRPDAACLREHAVTFLYRLAGEPSLMQEAEHKLSENPETETGQNALEEGSGTENSANDPTSTDLTNPADPPESADPADSGDEGNSPGVENPSDQEDPEPAAPKLQIPFTDVTQKDYYARAVIWAAENNITKGYADDNYQTFRPKDKCLREHIVTFLYRYDGL